MSAKDKQVELLEISKNIALSLHKNEIDINEFQKTLDYLKTKRNINDYYSYLALISNNGSVVIRSSRTLRYYRDIYKILLDYKEILENNSEYAHWILAWAARLVGYYTVASFNNIQEIFQHSNQPKKLTIPSIGDIFTSAITAIDETAAILLIPGFAIEKAVGVLKAESLPDGRLERYREGNSARVEVIGTRTQKSGRVILELKPAPKEKSS